MQLKSTWTVLVTFLLLLSLAYAADSNKAKVKGMITSRGGETLTVKSGESTTTVVLTEDTKTKDDRGLFGLEKQQMANAVLVPGLKVAIEGTSDDQGRVVA